MEELLKKIAELSQKIGEAKGEEKAKLEKELADANLELSKISKQLTELSAENKKLREAQVDLKIAAMIKEEKITDKMKDTVKSLMLEGKEKEVELLFSQPSPFRHAAPKDTVRIVGGPVPQAQADKVRVMPYSEFESYSNVTSDGQSIVSAKQIELMKQVEAKKLIIADDMRTDSKGHSRHTTPYDTGLKAFEMSKNDEGVLEFTAYDTGVSQTLSGSFLLPKVWEAKAILDLGNQNYGLQAVAMKATRADALTVAWNVAGTLANQGTSIHQGTTTGTTGIVITQVTMNPQYYGNSVRWEGNVGDWSVNNVKDGIIYPALLRDYNVTMDTEAVKVLLAASAVMDANTVLGGTWGRGTTRLGSNGTFNNFMLMDTRVALQAKTILQDNGATPIGNDFVLYASGEQLFSIMAGTGWQNAMQYADSTRLISGEIGRWMGIRFVENAAIKPLTRTQRKTAAGTGTTFTAIMVGGQALGKGFDIDFQLTYYPDFAMDAGRFKSLQWNSRGNFARLKVTEMVPIITTIAQDLYTV